MSKFKIWSVLGVEIEFMIVDEKTLAVVPESDYILKYLAHKIVNEYSLGEINVSNELVLHVLELKNNGPKPFDYSFNSQFYDALLFLLPILKEKGLTLLPTAAHPFMNPLRETKYWPYNYGDVYEQYNRIFNCTGHGWANIQSTHVTLPFANDEEFTRLHNRIRLLLPLLPALCASSPILEGKLTGYLDSRLLFYGKNQKKIPSISGDIIPEFIGSKAEYQKNILQPMYNDIAPYDPEGLLQYEWLNSRGAIAKFDYMGIEVRVLDTQECITADIAIAKLIFALLKDWDNNDMPIVNYPPNY